MNTGTSKSRLGAALHNIRQQRGLTLAELSRNTGFSVSSLSKVENDQLSFSYDKLIRLAEGLGTDVSQLFTPSPGLTAITRRSINRSGEGESVTTSNYDHRYLSIDVTRKKLIPILIEVRARTLEEFGELVRHSGEEFVYVLEGEIELHTEHYAPVLLRAGDSAYLDSTMGHGYLARGKGPCRALGVCSGSESELRAATRAIRKNEQAPHTKRRSRAVRTSDERPTPPSLRDARRRAR
jgi:transcriptional regulator with XRE-family HTH domain